MHDLNLGAIVVHLSPIVDPLDRDVVAAIPRAATALVVSDEDVFSVQSVNTMRDAHERAAPGSTPCTLRARRRHPSEPEHYAWVSSWLIDETSRAP
jgi:hypothetical protein